jgi:hypothetical protein
VQPEAAGALVQPGADFEQFDPQGLELGGAQLGVGQGAPKESHQLVGQGKPYQAKGIGGKAGAGKPVSLELVFELFAIVLGLAPALVEAKPGLRVTGAVGHQEASIGAFRPRCHFDQPPPGARPALGLVRELPVALGFLAGGLILGEGLLK